MRMSSFVTLALIGCHSGEPHMVRGVPATHLVPRGDIFYDCDAAAGHLSGWSQKVQQTGSITGRIFIAETRKDDTWPHFARVAVTGPARGSRAGFEMQVVDGDAALQPMLRFSNETAVRAEPAELPIAGASFELTWSREMVRVRFAPGGVWNEIPLSFEPKRVSLECSTANAVFHAVTVTSVAPPTEPATPAPQPPAEAAPPSGQAPVRIPPPSSVPLPRSSEPAPPQGGSQR
jgi:hypothetical protein